MSVLMVKLNVRMQQLVMFSFTEKFTWHLVHASARLLYGFHGPKMHVR